MQLMMAVSEPNNYDFEGTRAIAMLENSENNDPDLNVARSAEKREKLPSDFEAGPTNSIAQEDPLCHDTLQRVFRRAAWYSSAMSVIVILIGWFHRLGCHADSYLDLSSSVDHVFHELRVQRAVLHILGVMLHVSINQIRCTDFN
jgi:hypothetical protein